MLVTNAALQALRTIYNDAFKRGQSKASPKLMPLATMIGTTTKIGTYGFLGAFPIFRKWVGDKRFASVAERAYQLLTDNYEASLGIKKHDIQDDNLGIYPASFEGWGAEAVYFKDRMIAAALTAGNAAPCYDNQNFFDSNHPQYDDAGSTYSNISAAGAYQPWYLVDLSKPLKPLIFQEREAAHFWMITDTQDSQVADTGVFKAYGEARAAVGYTMPFLAYRSTLQPTIANIIAARDIMAGYKDEVGDPRGVTPTHIVYGASNRAAIEDAIKKQNLAGGESNVHWNEFECLYSERLA